MNYLLNFIMLVGLSKCFAMSKSTSPSEIVLNVTNSYSEKLKKEGIINRRYGVDCAGPDKIYDKKVHEISLGYSIDKNLKYQEARQLFYRLVDNLLEEINSHEEIRDYLFHWPVTYEDLDVSLSFDYECKGHLKKDDVDQIAIERNKIFYSIADVDGAKKGLHFNQTYPGMGTITHAGFDAFRRILRDLPETEDAATK